MYLFEDKFFEEEYNKYYSMREVGRKKDANIILENLMLYFDSLNDKLKRNICYDLCMFYLDKKNISEMQFPLSHRITEILTEDCKDNKMPQLRWYYQLTGDRKMLQKAFDINPQDEMTIVLLIDSILYDLWYGSHHMPYCCLIDKNRSTELLNKINSISKICTLSNDINEEYNYYLNLYNDWWTFEKEQSSKGFLEWCAKHKRKYDWVQAYYFKK